MNKVLILILILFSASCREIRQARIAKCEECFLKTEQCWNNFMITDDSAYLDSALYLLNEIDGTCEEKELQIKFNKIFFYWTKKDIDSAIVTMQSIDAHYFTMPKLKDIIINHLKIKKAKTTGDTTQVRRLYAEILNQYEYLLKFNKKSTDSTLRLPSITAIDSSHYIMPVYAYYYYKIRLQDTNKVFREIDSLKTLEGVNQKFIDKLKQSIDPNGPNPMFMPFE